MAVQYIFVKFLLETRRRVSISAQVSRMYAKYSMLSSFGTVPVLGQFNFIAKFFFVNKNKKLER